MQVYDQLVEYEYQMFLQNYDLLSIHVFFPVNYKL